jgi:hypothetical protein
LRFSSKWNIQFRDIEFGVRDIVGESRLSKSPICRIGILTFIYPDRKHNDNNRRSLGIGRLAHRWIAGILGNPSRTNPGSIVANEHLVGIWIGFIFPESYLDLGRNSCSLIPSNSVIAYFGMKYK